MYPSFEVLNVPLGLDTFEVVANFILIKFFTNWRVVLGAKLMVLLETGVGKVLACAQELVPVQDHLVDLLND